MFSLPVFLMRRADDPFRGGKVEKTLDGEDFGEDFGVTGHSRSDTIMRQMRDSLIGLLVVAIGILGYFLHSMNLVITDQQRQISDLSAKPKTSSLDLQEKCAKQAAWFFRDGWAKEKLAHYENHYNGKLDRCFAVVHVTTVGSGEVMNLSSLFDAFGGTDLGTFLTFSTGAKPRCFVRLPSGEEKSCSTLKEFDELIKAYMQ